MRLIILIAILYLAYRALKIWFRKNISEGSRGARGPGEQIDDIMVQDPVCGIYFPKSSGVSLNVGGEKLYFCSEECKEKYLDRRAENQKK